MSLLPQPCSALYWPDFLEPGLADRWFAELLNGLPWAQPEILIFGKRVPVPRREVWFGDLQAHYRYSGVDHTPLPWTPTLTELRHRLENHTGCAFNSVLINLYRDGRDANGWHSDDEKELGPEPVIASVSLGAARRFLLRPTRRSGLDLPALEISLEHGSLLLMAGRTQSLWQHTIPKQLRVKEPRINLTFRLIT
jgi:alkylated DNA repair dioxygenase AlkB